MGSGVLLILFEPRTAYLFVCYLMLIRNGDETGLSHIRFFCVTQKTSHVSVTDILFYVLQSPPTSVLCDSVLLGVVVGLSNLMSSCRLSSCFDLVQLRFGRFAWLGWGW